MNILLAKQNLKTFSNKKIGILAKYYKLENIDNKDDLLWLLAIKIHAKNLMFSAKMSPMKIDSPMEIDSPMKTYSPMEIDNCYDLEEINHYNKLSLLASGNIYLFSPCYKGIILYKDLKVTRVFSFSLFIQKELYLLFKKENNTVTEIDKITGWIDKYLTSQLKGFNKILNLQDWQEYGVIWFVQHQILEIMENPNFSKELIDLFMSLISNKRFSVIIYELQYTDPKHSLEFYSTVMRYYPFTYRKYDSVTIRDAHSTLPRERPHNHDYIWHQEFNSLPKKYFFYEGLWYRPRHYLTAKIPQKARFAAALTIKKMVGEKKCMRLNTFKEHFGLEKAKELSNEYGERIAYGVDEWLLTRYSLTLSPKDLFIVGITHLIYAIFPTANPLGMQYKEINNDIYFCLVHQGSGMPVMVYNNDVACNLITLYEYINKKYNYRNITLSELFGKIDDLIKSEPVCPDFEGNKEDCKIAINYGYRSIKTIPTAKHLWDFIFDAYRSNDPNDITLADYININKSMVGGITGASKFYNDINYTKLKDICNRNETVYHSVSDNFGDFDERT